MGSFEDGINAELPKRVWVDFPSSGHLTAGNTLIATGVALQVIEQLPGQLTWDLRTNYSWSGLTYDGIAGQSVGFGSILYYDADGQYWTSSCLTQDRVPCTGVSVTTSAGPGDQIKILAMGFMRDDEWGFNVGDQLYVGDEIITNVAPILSAQIVQVLGYAKSPGIIWFNPNQVWIQLV